MAAFVIQPHGRLQEWVADEKESYEAGKGRKGVDIGPEVGVSYEVAVRH
jgi:hypothetical protein